MPALPLYPNWLQKTSSGPYGGTLYHGTNKEFESFDLSFAGVRDWGDSGIGIYLSPSSSLATSYAHEAVKHNGGEPMIYAVKSNLQNVASHDELMESIRSVGVPEEKDTSIFSIHNRMQTRPEEDSRAITARMLELGFDGAAARGSRGEVIAYDPSLLQIVKTLTPEQARYMP